MNNTKSIFLLANSVRSVTQLLEQFRQAKNVTAIKKLHAYLLTTSLLFDSSFDVQTKLIFSYTTCLKENNLKTLTNCFKFLDPSNPFPYNVLLSDFYRNGLPFYALKTLSLMHGRGLALDSYSLCSCLIASSSVKDGNFGRQLHAHVAKTGWVSSVFVGSALVDLYCKLAVVNDARKVFDEIPVRNTVCANALLSGYSDAKLWDRVIELVREMPGLDLEYDHCSVSAMLKACAGLSAIELGRQVHAFIIRGGYGLQDDVFLQSSLIEVYGKCGCVVNARRVFNLDGFKLRSGKRRDVVLCTSMLGVLGKNGFFDEVIVLHKEMLKEGIVPDAVAFLTIIAACSHTGQVKLGLECFESMTRDFMLDPAPEHYSCMVDMLCRAGQLDKACQMVNEMISRGHGSSSVSMWGALLSACEEHGNIELGELAAHNALKLDSGNVGVYIRLSNLYARFDKWHEIGQLRDLMKERGFKKDVACSWI